VQTGSVQNVGINHCSRYILVSEQLLDGANIVAVLQQMSCKRMSPRKSYAHAVGVIGFLLR